jgi:hypothetical protein
LHEIQVAASVHFPRRGSYLAWYPQAILVPGMAAGIAELVEHVAAVIVTDSANGRYQAGELEL